MKKSDLVSYIKENIRTSLSPQNEASEEEVKNQAALNKELEKTVDLKKSMGIKEDNLDEDNDSEDAPAGDKETQKRASKQDKIISAFKSSFPDGLKDIIKKAKDGDKDALAKLKSKQDIIKAYNKLKRV